MLIIRDVYTLPYCVYAHYVDGQVIYIGSGETCRAFNLRSRTKHHAQLLQSGQAVEIAILARHHDRNEALENEKQMIRVFKPVANVRLGEPQPRNRAKGPPRTRKTVKPPKGPHIGKKSLAVLDVLRLAAETNAPCPTNADISARVGSTPYRIEDIVRSLSKRELIRVEMCGPSSRIIHVEGHSTQPTAETNLKGIPTIKHGRRVIDYIRV